MATCRPLHCWSSTGDCVDWLNFGISSHEFGDNWYISIPSWTVVDWRISILVAQRRDCPLSGLQSHRVSIMSFARGHLHWQNLNTTIPVEVVGVKSYGNSLLSPPCAPIQVSINKYNFVPERIVPGRIPVLSFFASKPCVVIVFLTPIQNVMSLQCIHNHTRRESWRLRHPVCLDRHYLGRTRCNPNIVSDMKKNSYALLFWATAKSL